MLNWYALNTKPRSEKFVFEGLAAQGIEAYLPLWQAPRHGPREVGPRPFFPSYLFARADLDVIGLSALRYMPGVRRLVSCGDQPASVPQGAIDRIRVQLSDLSNIITDASGQSLAPGDHVVITGGPLTGLEAIFDHRLSSGERVRLLINFIQNGAHVDVEREFVQKIAIRTGWRFSVRNTDRGREGRVEGWIQGG
jgi:transcriptional antiterminator RfaH